MGGLGDMRFVVVGKGAILEHTNSLSNLRIAETPKGRLATFSNTPKGETNSFELHIRMNEIKGIKFVLVEKFGTQLRIARLIGGDTGSEVLLSAIVKDPHVDEAVDKTWLRMVEKYGGEVTF